MSPRAADPRQLSDLLEVSQTLGGTLNLRAALQRTIAILEESRGTLSATIVLQGRRGGRPRGRGRERGRVLRAPRPLPARRGDRRARRPERPDGGGAAGEPRAALPRPLGRLPPLGPGRDVVRLRAHPGRAPDGGSARGGAALPGGPRLRPGGQVLRGRGLDGRPGGARPPPRRGGEKAPPGREHQAAARAHRALRHPQHRGQQPGHAGGVRAGGSGRPREHDGARPRGVGHRQGARGPRDPLLLPPREEALRQGELRGAAGEPDRVGAVRLRAGRLHRRARPEEGPLRAGPRRHDLPRRDRRAHALDAGEAAARAARARDRAAGRGAGDQGERARDRGHQQGPRGRGEGRGLPRGPLLPPQRLLDLHAAAAGAQDRHPAPRRPLRREARGRPRQGRAPDRDARRSTCS